MKLSERSENAENTSILFLNVFKTDCVIWFLNSQLFFGSRFAIVTTAI